MATDAERREVARRLRNEAKMPQPWVGFVFRDVMHAYPSEYKPTNECDDWEQRQHEKERDFINRLADLIEPSCDRDALLALAEVLSTPELETDCGTCPLRKWCEEARDSGNRITCFECKLWHTADVIHEALGIEP